MVDSEDFLRVFDAMLKSLRQPSRFLALIAAREILIIKAKIK